MLTEFNGPEIPLPRLTVGTAELEAVEFDGAFVASELPIAWQGQAPYSQLCWAACCAMALSANGRPTNALGAARLALGPAANDTPENLGWALSKVQLPWLPGPTDTGEPGGLGAPMSEQSMKQQICDGRKPVGLYWEYPGGTGHIGLVSGYNGTNQTWRVLDPLHDRGWVSYAFLRSYGGVATWLNTYYAIGNYLG